VALLCNGCDTIVPDKNALCRFCGNEPADPYEYDLEADSYDEFDMWLRGQVDLRLREAKRLGQEARTDRIINAILGEIE
jgi:hypothetical protein